MNKNTFYVIEEKETATGKTFARAEKIHNCNNLVYKFRPRNGFDVISINACDTWKEAQEVADCWNEGARKHGTYLFA